MKSQGTLLVTGATGLVGSHVVDSALQRGYPVRALLRPGSDTRWLPHGKVHVVTGDLTEAAAVFRAIEGVETVVHCAAKVGDWGPLAEYRRVNVEALDTLLRAADQQDSLRRFVFLSSLGVYRARHHYGTDETEPPCPASLDAYTRTKAEGEMLVQRYVREQGFPAIILRPGFIYGPRDRTVLPRLLDRLRAGQVVYFGSGEQRLNNTYVKNLVDAIFLAIDHSTAIGQVYNVTDDPTVSKRRFIATLAELCACEVPTKKIPLWLARTLAGCMETSYRLLRKQEAPLVSKAKVKFLGLNLDFSIEKARRELGYKPRWNFLAGMQESAEWFRREPIRPAAAA
jgi:nucleoside-diphosphate-sugar epimerase